MMLCARDGCEEKENRINGYCSVYCEDVDEARQQVSQLEADLERHEAQIRHYPDTYLGKIFFQGVECGRQQLEAENQRLMQYAQHKPWCTHCDCGFDALKEVDDV